MRVGFIGLGSQGGPMARAIADAGIPTTLWARRPASLEPYADTAAKTAATPAELAAASDIVCLCVVGDDDVAGTRRRRPDGLLAGMAPGGMIVMHSTIHPDTCRETGRKCCGTRYFGGRRPGEWRRARRRAEQLLVMVGGDEADVEKCRPVFESYADPVVHLGPVGAGQVTKILNNLLFSANLGSAISLLELGESLGVSRTRCARSLTAGLRQQQGAGQHRHFRRNAGQPRTDRRRAAAEGRPAGGRPRRRTRAAQQGAVFDAADAALKSMGYPR